MDTTRKPGVAPLHTSTQINFNGMGFVPFHHTLIVMKGNMTMPIFLLLKWNGIHVIPQYNGCNGWEYDTPPNSFMDSIAKPKVKTSKRGVGVCSLACSTLGVKGRGGAPRWGLGILTSNSITHTDLHKPNHKVVSA
jgi:hypothetical protein